VFFFWKPKMLCHVKWKFFRWERIYRSQAEVFPYLLIDYPTNHRLTKHMHDAYHLLSGHLPFEFLGHQQNSLRWWCVMCWSYKCQIEKFDQHTLNLNYTDAKKTNSIRLKISVAMVRSNFFKFDFLENISNYLQISLLWK